MYGGGDELDIMVGDGRDWRNAKEIKYTFRYLLYMI